MIEQMAILHSYSLKNTEWLSNANLKSSHSRIGDTSKIKLAPVIKAALNVFRNEDAEQFASIVVDDFNRLVDTNLRPHYVDALYQEFG